MLLISCQQQMVIFEPLQYLNWENAVWFILCWHFMGELFYRFLAFNFHQFVKLSFLKHYTLVFLNGNL